VQPAGRWEGARNQDAQGRKREVAAASGLNDWLGRKWLFSQQRELHEMVEAMLEMKA
jgi:hypothetical protein